MNRFGLRFHHIGLAVREPNDAMSFLREIDYEIGDPIFDPLQNVFVALCVAADMPDIELIMPGEGPGPLDLILKKQDSQFYHTCFVSSDVDGSIAAMHEAGHQVVPVAPPKPAVLFEGKLVSFYQVVGFGLIELIEDAGTNAASVPTKSSKTTPRP
ncbi:MAG: VOC family protein [Alphaproteobacteria bacterium]